jgi:hypothetical protein
MGQITVEHGEQCAHCTVVFALNVTGPAGECVCLCVWLGGGGRGVLSAFNRGSPFSLYSRQCTRDVKGIH